MFYIKYFAIERLFYSSSFNFRPRKCQGFEIETFTRTTPLQKTASAYIINLVLRLLHVYK